MFSGKSVRTPLSDPFTRWTISTDACKKRYHVFNAPYATELADFTFVRITRTDKW